MHVGVQTAGIASSSLARRLREIMLVGSLSGSGPRAATAAQSEVDRVK
jgi:hypothetical protein